MTPDALVAPSNFLGFPAPYWFLVSFKTLGFSLHTAFMNIWYAGPLIALILWFRGGHARTLTGRLMKAMPIIIAYGINLGIVPLLFIQVAYYKAFYPSTILMAWPWFSVIILLTIAYYGIYIYAGGLRHDGDSGLATWRRVSGWVAASFFILIGFIFANEFSLLTNLDKWKSIWQAGNISGAVSGLALNIGDPSLWPRWLMMFGLAITTTAAFMALDTGIFASRESDDYRKWASSFAFRLYSLGILWFALTGLWYVMGTWSLAVSLVMFSSPAIILTILTAGAVGLPWLLLIFFARGQGRGRNLALVIGLAQFGVIALNAVSRQVVQNAELEKYMNIAAEETRIQWSPMILFLLLFVAGVALMTWMIMQAVKSGRNPVPPEAAG